MPDIKILKYNGPVTQGRADLDILLDSRGFFADDPIFVTGGDKIIQDVVKGILTVQGSNYLAPNCGTNIEEIRRMNIDQAADLINNEIQTMLGYLNKWNEDEPIDEQIQQINELQARQLLDTIEVDMTLTSGSGENVQVTV